MPQYDPKLLICTLNKRYNFNCFSYGYIQVTVVIIIQNPPYIFISMTDETIDFVKHYQLVDQQKLDMYARAYVVEDEDLDYRIDAKVYHCLLLL